MKLTLLAVLYVLLATSGLLALRRSLGAADLSRAGLSALLGNPLFVGGAVLYASSFVTWLFALRRHEATTVYPIFAGAAYCGVLLGGAAFLGESFPPSKLAGTVLVFAGIVLIVH